MDSKHLLTSVYEQIGKLRTERPEIVYHYTDFFGLKGILSSHKLWATSIRALNDGSELTFAEKVLCDHFDVLFAKDNCEFSAQVKQTRQQLYGNTSFVTCFCEADDLLSMWRGYAAHGGGYCLGFRQDILREIQKDSVLDGLVKLLYDDTLPNALADTCQAIYECAVKSGNSNSWGYQAAATIVTHMFDLIKHPAFEEEKEWRLIRSCPPVADMQFRSGPSLVKPYVELGMPAGLEENLPLRTVRFGPTLRPQETKQAIEWMLEKYGYTGVSVEPSKIPYRL